MNPGNFSNSTLSVTWNLLLLCFLGVFPAIGIVSLAPPLSLPKGPLGGPPPGSADPPAEAPSSPTLLGTSAAISEDDETTTMGGAGEVLSLPGAEDLRSGVEGACC